MWKACLLLSLSVMMFCFSQVTSASNTTARELAADCNPQNEADAKALAQAVLTINPTPGFEQFTSGAQKWLRCEAYMDGFIRGYNTAFQIGMGFTEYYLKSHTHVDVDDAQIRRAASHQLGRWYLCLPDLHSSALEAHVVSDYLSKNPQALSELSEKAVKEAFRTAFTKTDGSCK